MDERCNVYDGEECCGGMYCHELPSFSAFCRRERRPRAEFPDRLLEGGGG